MINRPPIGYAGGKNRIKQQLRPWTHSGNRLVSPFIGLGSVEIDALYHGIPVVAGDIDINIATFWNALKETPQELYEVTNNIWPKPPLKPREKLMIHWRRIKEGYENSEGLEKIAYWIAVSAFSYRCLGLKAGSCVRIKTYTQSNRIVVDSLVKYKLNNLDVIHASWEDIVAKAEEGDVVFLDPPYPGNVGEQLYLHHQMNWIEFYDTLDVLSEKGIRWCLIILPDEYCHKRMEGYELTRLWNKYKSHQLILEYVYSNFNIERES